MVLPQGFAPFRPQSRNAPGTPAPLTGTAAGGTAPSAPQTDPVNVQGRAAPSAQDILVAVNGLSAQVDGQQRLAADQIVAVRGDISAMAARIEAIERSRVNGSARGNSDVHTGTYAPSGFSAAKFLMGLHLIKDGRHADAMRVAKSEFEACEAAEREFPHMKNVLANPAGMPGSVERVMVTSSNSAGGYLLPPEFSTELIQLARNKMVLTLLGARMLTGLTGSPFTMPRQSGAGTAYWLATEGVTAITPSDLTFEQLSGSFKTLAMLMIASRISVDLTNPAIEAIIRDDMAAVIAREWQTKAFKGTTGGAHPVGILETSGIGAPLGAAIDTVANLNSYSEGVEVANLTDSKPGIVMNPKVRNAIQRMGNLGGYGYLMSPIGNDAVVSAFLGYPVHTTNALVGTSGSAEVIYCGNWLELFLLQWGGLVMEVSDHYQFNLHNRALKTVGLFDVQLAHKLAFVGSKVVTYT